MNQSDSIANIAKALNRVQAEHLFALTDKSNPFFKSKYADLSSVWTVARTPLIENGLSVVQTFDVGNNGLPIIVTTLLHTSGEWIKGSLEMPILKPDPQAVGSSITYARRYALSAMVGICPEDDDGEKGMARKQSEKPKKEPSGEMSKKQSDAIMKIGNSFDLTESEIIEMVKWKAEKENLNPRSWKIVNSLMPRENFEAVLTEYIEHQGGRGNID